VTREEITGNDSPRPKSSKC